MKSTTEIQFQEVERVKKFLTFDQSHNTGHPATQPIIVSAQPASDPADASGIPSSDHPSPEQTLKVKRIPLNREYLYKRQFHLKDLIVKVKRVRPQSRYLV
jgi:hypothetical protein